MKTVDFKKANARAREIRKGKEAEISWNQAVKMAHAELKEEKTEIGQSGNAARSSIVRNMAIYKRP